MSSSQIILFDGPNVDQLLPIVYTRASCAIRLGILTIQEKWEMELNLPSCILSRDYLSPLYDDCIQTDAQLYINGGLLPSALLIKEIAYLDDNCGYFYNGVIILFKSEQIFDSRASLFSAIDNAPRKDLDLEIELVTHPWHIFKFNGRQILLDINRLGLEANPEVLSSSNKLISEEHIYIEEGAKVEGAFLNASEGPIYIGKDTEVMEGSVIRGPFALCEHSVVKMSAKIYGDTTIGPYSKVGGEITNSVILGYSNKGHDGFLGNSVLGEWCNLGADTNTSNLKNNYGQVAAWDYEQGKFIDTGLQFCGLIMGDHSKSGINTMFNTGTVVGVSCNIFGGGFPRKFLPSFSWGGYSKLQTFDLDKACDVAERMMSRRKKSLSETERQILKFVFESDAKYRNDKE